MQIAENGVAQTEGVQIAREMLEAVQHRVQGVYVMPPFSRHQMAIDVLNGYICDLATSFARK